MSGRALFHVVDPAAYAEARRTGGHWAPASLEREGFVHLSTAEQLDETIALHYAGVRPLLVLELDGDELGPALVFEASRGGLPFPHLYRAIEFAEVRSERRIE